MLQAQRLSLVEQAQRFSLVSAKPLCSISGMPLWQCYICVLAMLYVCADTTISTPIYTGNGGWGGGHGTSTSFHMGMPGRCFFIIFIFICIFQIFLIHMLCLANL